MAKTKLWYIVNVRSGRELFLHELFVSTGFDVYSPFETKFQAPRSRKARAERQASRPYADPLFKGYLFVGTDKDIDDALMGMAYIIDRRADAYSFMVHRDAPVVLTCQDMENWQNSLHEALSDRKRIVLRGYDPVKDARKNQKRLYGQEAITIPNFTRGEKVKFIAGGFEGLGAEVTECGDAGIKVMTKFFGVEREIVVDPYELQKAS